MKTALAPAINFQAAPAALLKRPTWLRIIHGCQPALAWAGWLHVALLAAALVLWPLDERTITGLNVWVKPIKFSIAGVVYLWSLAWLLADLPAQVQRSARRIGRLVGVALAIEISCVYLQAARGTTSHFNISSWFDAIVFQLMGVFILINTVAIVWAIWLMFRHRPHGSSAWVWGMRLGLILFLVGSAVGGSMSARMAHTVGAADGGAGLPLLGWSTRHGDLRAAHFLGLHALQAIPLVGWLITRYLPQLRPGAQALGVVLFAALYTGAVAWLYWHAVQGLPLVSLP
ncbi:hypothetical protein [Hymenobacter latericus]|uniref:hypothetical protein n=1 Tax=Hymenobacter sp. YIM 151858-1 TaxID=2987688 RepID=UPI002226AE87|nr:hypothetical protein [Hymenobacter sp. YIM 151858-1]UYZ59513.1 hypothetical protein OIS50_01640 [Hymenobacter sp. YIM 151858-1]